MNLNTALNRAAAQPIQLALGVGIVLGVVYLLGRSAIKETASAVGGIVSGDNAITRGTPYQGAGVVGTVGAATNAATGGLLERFGSWIGGRVYDTFGGNLEAARIAAERKPPDERTVFENLLTGISGG